MNYFRYILFIAIAITLYSCGTTSKFASSFGKRKYTHGYYIDYRIGVTILPLGGSTVQNRQYATIQKMNSASHTASSVISKEVPPCPPKEGSKSPLRGAGGLHNPALCMEIKPGSNLNQCRQYLLELPKEPDDLDSLDMAKKDVNYLSIAGCAFSAAGAIATLLAGTLFLSALTWASIILLSLGVILGIMGLISNRYYLNWMSIVGFGIIVGLLILDLL